MTGRLMVWAWSLTRLGLVAAALLGGSRTPIFGDPLLIWSAANGLPVEGEVPTITEYPALVRSLTWAAEIVPSRGAFVALWLVAALVIDAALAVVLARRSPRSGWMWIVTGALLGPVVWTRIELLVALLCVLAVLNRRGRPGTAGLLLGLAALIKLWPLALAATLLPGKRCLRFGFFAAATVLIGMLVDLLVLGPSSVTDPWVYQSERGLQIESLLATVPMVLAHGENPASVIEFEFRAYQLRTDVPPSLDLLSLGAVVLTGTVLMVVIARAPHREQEERRAVATALLAVVIVAVNTVFSPQYVLWFLALIALALAERRVPRPLPLVVGAVCVLTQMIFPWGYRALVFGETWALAALVMRNVALLALGILLVVWLVKLRDVAIRGSTVRHGIGHG